MIPNDHWTLQLEKLGMAETGSRLARLTLQCQPPYAICVQGKWGSGKTSLMRHAMASLGGEPLAMTLKTASEPRKELPLELQKRWNHLAEGATDRTREVYLSRVGCR